MLVLICKRRHSDCAATIPMTKRGRETEGFWGPLGKRVCAVPGVRDRLHGGPGGGDRGGLRGLGGTHIQEAEVEEERSVWGG